LAEAASLSSQGRPNASHQHGLAEWQTKRVLGYIEAHLEQKMNVQKLAALVSFSKGYFSRAFKESLGSGPMTYVVVRRVERAKGMMAATRAPLKDIALACGFGDQPHLTRWFRRLVGLTPGQYRRMGSQLSHWGDHDAV
jgi:AraC family transcriptional regulator